MKKILLNKVGTNWTGVFLISLLIGIASLLIYSKDVEKSNKALISEAEAITLSLNSFVSTEYSSALQDIYFFSKNPGFSEYISGGIGPITTQVIEKTSSAFLKIRPSYVHFILLDSLGNQKLNLDIQKEGVIKRSLDEIQNGKNYFPQIKGLARNEVFVSPIHFFQEGTNEVPVIQFIMPVFQRNTEIKVGYVRFDYSAKRILDQFEKFEKKDSVIISLIDNKKNFVFRENKALQEAASDYFKSIADLEEQDKDPIFSEVIGLFFTQPFKAIQKVDTPLDQIILSNYSYRLFIHYTPQYLTSICKEIKLDILLLALIRIIVSSAVLLYFLRLLRHKNKLLEEKSVALEKRNADLETSKERMGQNIQRIRDFAFEKNSALSALRQKEKDLKQAQEIAQLGYYERDLVAGKSFWSDNLPSIFGLPSDYDFNAQSVENIMQKEEFEEVERAFDKAVEDVKEYKVVYKVYHKNGKVEFLQDIAMPVVKDGKVVSMKGTIQNLTERVGIEKELLDAKIKAEAAVKAKSDFLATMSHEIRTPLNAVIGMSTLLNETNLSEKQEDFVQTIKVSGNSLLAVINDILDFSKIESGEMKLEKEPFNLNKMVEDCLQVISVIATQKKIKLFYKIDKNAPEVICGDEGRIRQSIINLLNNAVKFTDKGEVKIHITVDNITESRCDLKVAILDTGIGIEKEKQESIFSAFQQADSSITRKFGGTGLGLAITQKLIQLMGGTLELTSEIGEGSEFYFCLDVKSEWGIKNLTPVTKSLIIISDETNEAKTAKEIFTEKGVEVSMMHFRTGDFGNLENREIVMFCEDDFKEEFIQLGESLVPSNNRVHFVCDIQKEMVECASFRLVNRPFKLSWINQLIYQGNSNKARPKLVENKSDGLNKDLKILVAEDNPINQKLIRLLFENLGYQIDLAEDGVMAVKASQNKKYDLIFMDIQMPQMGGVEATKYIKEDHGENAPYIIALTANALDGDKEKYLKEGLDDYLSKPINMDELKDKIQKWQNDKTQKGPDK